MSERCTATETIRGTHSARRPASFQPHCQSHHGYLLQTEDGYQLQHPKHSFAFVIGSELVESIRTWDAPGVPDAGERLWRGECKFLIVSRPSHPVPPDLPPNFYAIRASGMSGVTELAWENAPGESSAEVVRRVEGGGYTMVDGLVAPAVLAHMQRYKLYKEQNGHTVQKL